MIKNQDTEVSEKEPVTTLFLVRHGQTEWNVQCRLQGQHNSPLTPKGRTQALEVRKKLASVDIHKAYVSPLGRALETLDAILEGREVEIVKSTGLQEISLGPWEGKTKEETKQTHPIEYEQFWTKQNDFLLPGAETYYQLQARVVQAIRDIFSDEENSNILVVSHWIAIKVAIAFFSSISLAQLSDISDPGNGKLIKLRCEGDKVSISA